MDTVLTNLENSKNSDSHKLGINFANEIYLKKSDKYFPLSSFSIKYT